MRAAPRWGPLPWFVLVLTGLVVLLVVILPPFVLDESSPPGWVERRVHRAASWHGDPDPVEAIWAQTTWETADQVFAEAEAKQASVGPSPSPTLQPTPEATVGTALPGSTEAPSPSSSRKPVDDPSRTMYLVALRGRFDSGPHGGPPPPSAPERWLLVAYDSVTHERWELAVFDRRPDLPEDVTKLYPL